MKCQRLITYLHNPSLVAALEENIYGFSYNPPGFEIPYSLENLSHADGSTIFSLAEGWLQRQVLWSYNPETKMMDRNCVDPATQSARLYEAARFSDHFFETLEVDIPLSCEGYDALQN